MAQSNSYLASFKLACLDPSPTYDPTFHPTAAPSLVQPADPTSALTSSPSTRPTDIPRTHTLTTASTILGRHPITPTVEVLPLNNHKWDAGLCHDFYFMADLSMSTSLLSLPYIIHFPPPLLQLSLRNFYLWTNTCQLLPFNPHLSLIYFSFVFYDDYKLSRFILILSNWF